MVMSNIRLELRRITIMLVIWERRYYLYYQYKYLLADTEKSGTNLRKRVHFVILYGKTLSWLLAVWQFR